MGWLAFVLALAGLGPAGAVFGHLGLRAVGRGEASNRGVAFAGTVLSYASVAIVVGLSAFFLGPGLVSALGPKAAPSETLTPGAGAFTLDTSPTVADHWFGLEVGDCVLAFDDAATPGDLMIERPEVVPCTQSHYAEVYAVADIEGDTVPDDSDFRRHTREVCAGDAFTSYVGTRYAESALYYDVLYPAEHSWETGTHQMVCLLVEEDQETTGSLRGAGSEPTPSS